MMTEYHVWINTSKVILRKTLKGAIALAERESNKDKFSEVSIVRLKYSAAGSAEKHMGLIRKIPTDGTPPFWCYKRTGVFGSDKPENSSENLYIRDEGISATYAVEVPRLWNIKELENLFDDDFSDLTDSQREEFCRLVSEARAEGGESAARQVAITLLDEYR